MPSSVSWNNNNVLVTYTGILTKTCVQSAVGKILGNPDFALQKYQINDFSQLTCTTLTKTEVRMISGMDRNANRWNDKLYCAFLINDDIKELMDVYLEVMSETSWILKTFHKLQDSKNWIASIGFEV
jgi:hypothetical protein